jgi:hypothetical protein
MQRVQEKGNRPTGQGRRWRSALTLSSCACCLLLVLNGCSSTQKNTQNGDPLYGESLPKTYGPPAPKAGAATTSKAGGLPALPTATESTSIAALAQGDPLTGDDRTPLAISAKGPTQPAGVWQAEGKPAVAQNVGATLKRPEPMAEPLPAATRPVSTALPDTVPANSWPSGAGVSYEQLQDQLTRLKVKWQNQVTFNDGFKFTCIVPNPSNPDFNRTYEATARDYKSAILAVLEQIDRDRQGK